MTKLFIYLGFPFRVVLGLAVIAVTSIIEPYEYKAVCHQMGWTWMKTGASKRLTC